MNNLINKVQNTEIFQDVLKGSKEFLIDNYISNNIKATNSIIKSLEVNQRTLLVAPMGVGKTHFVMNDAVKSCIKNNLYMIIVLPNVFLLDSFKIKYGDRYNLAVVHGKSHDDYKNARIIATTPESLNKVVDECCVFNKPFMLVEDEAHQKGIDTYRTGYRYSYIQKALNEPMCRCSLHLTATPTTLIGEKYNEVIKIESRKTIKSEFNIIDVEKGMNDTLLEASKHFLSSGFKTILFNNNIDDNKSFEGVISNYDKTLDIQQVNASLESPDNIKNSKITADLTIITSAILAGIDLKTPDNAVLLINSTGANVDNIIQLIGRFRNGIKVYFFRHKPKKYTPYMEFKDLYNESYLESLEACKIANKNSRRSDYYKTKIISMAPDNLTFIEGSVVDSLCLTIEHNKWVVDEVKLKSKVAKDWSRILFSQNSELVKYFRDQLAFEVSGDVTIKTYKNKDAQMAEIKKLTRKAKKERTKEIVASLEEYDDRELLNALKGEYEEDSEIAELLGEYKKLNKNNMDKIYKIKKYFYEDDKDGILKAFRKLHSEKSSEINKEMYQIDAREINRVMNRKNGNVLLEMDKLGIHTARDVRQCKIRYFLRGLERKRGRISDNVLTDLTMYLIKEGNLGNGVQVESVQKKYLGYEKDFEKLKLRVYRELSFIYNFKDENVISSVKI